MNISTEKTEKYLQYKIDGKTIFLDLLVSSPWDVKNMPTKNNCVLFRYTTVTTLAGGFKPAIMVNIKKALIYFWNENKNNWDSKGIKNDFPLNVVLSDYTV